MDKKIPVTPLIDKMFLLLDNWFEKARKNKFSSVNDSIESELEAVIENEGSRLLVKYKVILKNLFEKDIIEEQKDFFQDNFKSIAWKNKSIIHEKYLDFPEEKESAIIFAFKHAVLISNSIYKLIFYFKVSNR